MASFSSPDKLSVDLNQLIQLISDDRLLFESLLNISRETKIIDLWERNDLAVSYWVLLLTGVNQEEEMVIAQALLSWQHFFSKTSARVACLQSSERNEFRCCSLNFDVVNCPTLVFSDSPDMQNYVKIDSELLFLMAAEKGGLQRFFTRLHSLVENGTSSSGVKDILITEKFWKTLKLAYGEVKGLISFSKAL